METVTHYDSASKGRVAIVDMPHPHLSRTLATLQRENGDAATIAAMQTRLAELDAMPDDAARIAATTPGMGHNKPPEPTPVLQPTPDTFDALKVHFDDLYVESKAWADGAEIQNEAQFAEVNRLLGLWDEAIKGAQRIQDAELAPLAKAEKEIRERFYPLIGKTSKVTGMGIRAKTALLTLKTKWGDKVRAAQALEAERLRKEAADKAREALQAVRAADGDLEATESAEDLIKAAQASLKSATQAEKATVGPGYRTEWVTTIADDLLAIRTMWRKFPDEFKELALSLAKREVREGKRSIEGFDIFETKVAVR